MSMKHLSLLLISLCFALFAEAQSTVSGSLNVAGQNRTYRLRIPPAASSGELLPLVISMHGFTQTAAIQESQTAMNAVADTGDFFVVYPNGSIVLLFLQTWNADLSGSNSDINFIDALITHLAASYPIDAERVFATGFSAGGAMAVSLACALSDRIKAIAPVAASINPANAPLCNPTSFRPLLQIHGTSDVIVPYNGSSGGLGPALAPAEGFFRAWSGRDACPSPVFSNLPNLVISDFSTVTLASLGPCASGQSYRFYRVNNGDHSVPGPGGQNKDLYSSAAIWDFFRSQGGASPRLSPYSAPETGPQITLLPNPSSSSTTVQTGLNADWTLQIFDLYGRLVMTQAGSGSQAQLSVSSLPIGLYELVLQSNEAFSARTRLQVMR